MSFMVASLCDVGLCCPFLVIRMKSPNRFKFLKYHPQTALPLKMGSETIDSYSALPI